MFAVLPADHGWRAELRGRLMAQTRPVRTQGSRLAHAVGPAQVMPVVAGIPWLGFVVYPDRRLVKARKVRSSTRHLAARLDDYEAGRIGFGEFDASVQGWINHVRYADTWGLREHVLGSLLFTRRP